MFTLKKNIRDIKPARHQKLVDMLHVNGWKLPHYLVTFETAPFNVDLFMEYVPENGVAVENEFGKDVKFSRADIRKEAELHEGNEYPEVYAGSHRTSALNTLELMLAHSVKGVKVKEAKDIEEAEKLEYDTNVDHKYAEKLQYADDFMRAYKGYKADEYQRECELHPIWAGKSGRGQRQRCWYAIELMDEFGITMEEAIKIPNWATGKKVRAELEKLEAGSEEIGNVVEEATKKVNAEKVMPGKEIRKELEHAKNKLGDDHFITQVLSMVEANAPATLRQLINASIKGKTPEVEAEAEAEAVTA